MGFFLAGIFGSIFGAIIGLIPGLHPNLFAYLIFAAPRLEVAVFLFCALASGNIFGFLSAAYMKIPSDGEIIVNTSLGRFAALGRMDCAIRVVIICSAITYSLAMALAFFLGKIASLASEYLSGYSWILLLMVCIIIILGQNKRFLALSFFILSGILGLIAFNLNLNEPFLPLLSGMFGLSSMAFESQKASIPKQLQRCAVESGFVEFLWVSIIGIFSSIAMMLIPAISPSQIGFFSAKMNDDELKVGAMASINVADSVLSLMAFFYIGKARSGTIKKIGEAMIIGLKEYYLILICGFFAIMFSSIIALWINKKLGKNPDWLSSKYFKIGIILFIILLCAYFDGILGLMVLSLSVLLGRLLKIAKVRTINLTGSLAVPTLLFFILRLI